MSVRYYLSHWMGELYRLIAIIRLCFSNNRSQQGMAYDCTFIVHYFVDTMESGGFGDGSRSHYQSDGSSSDSSQSNQHSRSARHHNKGGNNQQWHHKKHHSKYYYLHIFLFIFHLSICLSKDLSIFFGWNEQKSAYAAISFSRPLIFFYIHWVVFHFWYIVDINQCHYCVVSYCNVSSSVINEK